MSEKRLSLLQWQKIKRIPDLLDLRVPPPDVQLARIRTIERNVGLPVKAAVMLVLIYYFFVSNWIDTVREPSTRGFSQERVMRLRDGQTQTDQRVQSPAQQRTLEQRLADLRKEMGTRNAPQERLLQLVAPIFLAYMVVNGGFATLLIGMRHFSLRALQNIVFLNCLVDTAFFGALSLLSEGFESPLFWVFIVLIVRNTISIPSAARQLFANLSVAGSYLLAGVLAFAINQRQFELYDEVTRQGFSADAPKSPWSEPFLLRLSLLVLVAICCYGVQFLMEKQRRADEEAREFQLRQEQLQAAGRLAAEIAHQLKNPLGIINNAAYTLQKTVKEGKTITQQIRIIREEVERSDRIITELMGYARLSEGQVEKLDITEELDRAIEQVFPPAAKYDVTIQRHYGAALPTILAQRGHLSEAFVNILQNAREAMDGRGHIDVSARFGDDYSVEIRIQDSGPGIPKEKIKNVFEPYFTTKEKGTGLGLAIVKHNTELYNGTVEVQSETGKGACFVVRLPAKTVFNVRK